VTIDYVAIAPEIALASTALVVLLLDLVLSDTRKRLANPVAMLGTIAAIVLTVQLWGDDRSTFGGMFVVNDFAVVFKLLFLGALVAILFVSYRYFATGRYFQGEYYFLLVTAFVGMLVMPSARDLLLLFVALETVSIPAFIMAGLRKRDLYSTEAAIKFFLIGVLSVAIMLFGMSLLYGFTGTTSLEGIAEALRGGESPPLLLASLMLVIAGFAFKVSAVPFHFWAPDTYAGSPMPVAAMLAVASKAAGFAGLAVIAFIAFEPVAEVWTGAVMVIAIITMTVGNLIALQQRDIVRLLAYSSVAHAGWMLVPFGLIESGAIDLNDRAAQATLFYIVAYAIMNIGAFGVAVALALKGRERAISDFEGLGYRAPMLAVAMTTFLVALGGVVPTVGFWAKFAIFDAVVASGSVGDYVVAGLLILNAVVALFYYLRVAYLMWMRQPRLGAPILQPGIALSFILLVLMVATVVLGLLPGLVTDSTSVTSVLAGS